jgi:hypothetical protein
VLAVPPALAVESVTFMPAVPPGHRSRSVCPHADERHGESRGAFRGAVPARGGTCRGRAESRRALLGVP